MRVRHQLIWMTCGVALMAGCGPKPPNAHVASATYSVPKTIDDLATRANIVVRGTLLTEPSIKQVQLTPAEPGERSEESLWVFETSQVRVTEIVTMRPQTKPWPAVGDTITVGVAIVNPAVGNSITPVDRNLPNDFPKAGTSLTGRIEQVGLFILSGQRDLGAADTRGFEVVAYQPSGDAAAAIPLVAVADPLRGTTSTETELVDACRLNFSK